MVRSPHGTAEYATFLDGRRDRLQGHQMICTYDVYLTAYFDSHPSYDDGHL